MGEDNYKTVNFYSGADYGLDPDFGKDFSAGVMPSYRPTTANFGFPSDPRTSNQLAAVSQKLNTGAKTIEVSAVNISKGGGPMKLIDTIPKQQFKEIHRLKKLVGVDLTFHGPIIEPSGFGGAGWSEDERMQAERQIFSAIERGHDLDPKGNLVITFHSSGPGLPELSPTVKNEKGEIETPEAIVYNSETGKAQRLKPREEFLLKEGKKLSVDEQLKKFNSESWTQPLASLAFTTRRGLEVLEHQAKQIEINGQKLNHDEILSIYQDTKTLEGQKRLESYSPEEKKVAQDIINDVSYADANLKNAYTEMQERFNSAYRAAEKEKGKKNELEKLREYGNHYREFIKKNPPEDARNLLKWGEEIQRGVNMLNSLSAPESWKPMNDFMIDKSSDTFANAALQSYKKFKDSAPIISIENPPAGGPISRAEDLGKLVKQAREKFVEKAKDKLGMSESEAQRQAEKLIGVTWDVGHINMIRQFGFDDKDLKKETEKIARYVKHVHLSDNFGYEHTELPMGMGNVPMKGHIEALQKYGKQFAKIKQVVETGDWFQDFKTTPFRETLRAFGSPIYSMSAQPFWNQIANSSGGYFAGYGTMLPDVHFSQLYGAGFSNIPPELGGQMSGRSRASGAPME